MAKHKESLPYSIDEIADRLLPLLKELDAARDRAKALGLFAEDRDLLECLHCGLQEDVASDGQLLVYHRGQPEVDSGMRFIELGADLFRCPSCDSEVPVVAEQG